MPTCNTTYIKILVRDIWNMKQIRLYTLCQEMSCMSSFLKQEGILLLSRWPQEFDKRLARTPRAKEAKVKNAVQDRRP